MKDYNEVVKQLRYCANDDPICDMTEVCPFYDQRDEEYGYYRCVERMMENAADAIEELQKQLQKSEADNVNLTGWLAMEHAKNCPHYIHNKHDRGDDSLCDVLMTEPPKEETE